jgi:flagellar hook-associated protein 2
MAEGILGLGSSGSNGLSQELIDKLKAAEAKSKVDIYDVKLEDWDKELETLDNINLKINELLSAVDNFDLYKATPNAFEQVTASTTGTSAVFDAVDIAGLEAGTNTVTVSQLAQKDVYQSNILTDANGDNIDASAIVPDGTISINVAGTDYDFATNGLTYEELAEEINKNEKLNASVEQVGDNEYRLVIKSADTGLENALTITQTDLDLGLEDSANKVLTAQNMLANVDGIDYNVSSNTLTIQGNLTMTALELGTSTISIQEDNSTIMPGIKDIVTKYNELLTLVDTELYSADSAVSDTGTLKLIMDSIKDSLFASYGPDDDLNVFNYGFSLDSQTGEIILDEEKLSEAIANNPDDIEAMFVGVAERPGIGTRLKEYLDALDGYDGLMTNYGENMTDKKTELEEDKKTAQEVLDEKYNQMSLQFASYTAMITQMENSFNGMKLMIDQSTAS